MELSIQSVEKGPLKTDRFLKMSKCRWKLLKNVDKFTQWSRFFYSYEALKCTIMKTVFKFYIIYKEYYKVEDVYKISTLNVIEF